MNDINQKYDLEERTAKFGEDIIKLSRGINLNAVTSPIVNQLVRSSTSIGANYMEANGAMSKKDFRHKIYLCKKEAQETKHWLRMLSTAYPESKTKSKELWKECQELTLIFGKIVSTLKN